MSLDERLRQGLEGLDALVGPPPDDVVEVVLGRGRRSRRDRRLATAAVAVVAVVTAFVVAPKAIDALRSADERRPAMPGGKSSRIDLKVSAIGFSEDGTQLFVTDEGGGTYDAMTGELVRAVEWKDGDGVVMFSPDGTLFATAVGDPNCCDMYVYETATGREFAHVG